MIRSSQKRPPLSKHNVYIYVFTNSPLQFAFKAWQPNFLPHNYFFFQSTVLQFWRFLDPMLTYFCSSESNAVSFDYILLSSQVLRCDLRRCVMRQGVRQKTQIAIEPTWTLQVCRWNPHFCQNLGVEIWVGVTRHSQAIHFGWLDLFRLKGLQLMSITIEGPCCPHGWCLGTQLRVWFQLPENCLRGDTRSAH